MASAVVLVGALVTIGTSAPANPTFATAATIEVEAGRATHIVVRVSRAGVTADRFEMLLRRSAGEAGTLSLTPDDPALEAEVSETGATPVTSLILDGLAPLCPGDGDCDLGFDVDVGTGSGTFEVRVEARISRFADPRFLFPENRSFPPGASIEIVVE